MFKNLQKYYFFRENKRNNILKYTVFPLIFLILGSFLLANTAFLSSITEESIIDLTNQERNKLGISPLTANQLLAQAAYEKGRAILATQKFQHNINGEKFSNWIKKTGYKYDYVGENLAIDFITSEGVIKAWLKSPTHKKNLLNKRFKEIGVAVINGKFDGNDAILVVQIFGSPKFLPNKNIGLNNTAEKLALIPDNKILNNFPNANPILLNSVNSGFSENSTDELFLAQIKNYSAEPNNKINNKFLYYLNILKLSAGGKLSQATAKFNSNYLLLIILFLILYLLYLYNNYKLIYKIKFLLKKEKTQLRLPLR